MSNDDQTESQTEQDNLVGYGFAKTEPPLVRRKVAVQSPTSDKLAGFVGVEKRRTDGARVYTAMRTDYHFYRVGGGYAFSDSILNRLEHDYDVSRILIHEGSDPEDDVYEFPARAYYNDGEPVEQGHLLDESDPQTYVPLEDHLFEWESHAISMFTQSFENACDRIFSKRGWN